MDSRFPKFAAWQQSTDWVLVHAGFVATTLPEERLELKHFPNKQHLKNASAVGSKHNSLLAERVVPVTLPRLGRGVVHPSTIYAQVSPGVGLWTVVSVSRSSFRTVIHMPSPVLAPRKLHAFRRTLSG